MLRLQEDLPEGLVVRRSLDKGASWEELAQREGEALKDTYAVRTATKDCSLNIDECSEGETEPRHAGHLRGLFDQSSQAAVVVTSKELVVSVARHVLCVPYPAIILHALCPQEEGTLAFLYLQVDTSSLNQASSDDEQEFIEMRIRPRDIAVEELYDALCECSLLHTGDDGDGLSDDDDEEEEGDAPDTADHYSSHTSDDGEGEGEGVLKEDDPAQ